MNSLLTSIRNFAKRHKKKLFVLLCTVIVIIMLPHTVSVRFDHLDDANAIFSIAFDRWQMNRVNRVELVTSWDGVIVVQDAALARDIVDATMVATHAGPASFGGSYIHLYRGNRRVRRMRADGHIIEISRLSGKQVYLPPELASRLSQYRMDYVFAAFEERVAHRRPLADAITVSHPQEELLSSLRVVYSHETTLFALDRKFPVEVLRTFDSESLPYVVYRLEEGGYAFLFFRRERRGYSLDFVFVVKESLTRQSFDEIEIGSSFAEVEAVDSGFRTLNSIITDYAPLGWDVREQASIHMVREGFIRIQYDSVHQCFLYGRSTEELYVTSIEFIPNGELLRNSNYRFLEEDFPR